MKAHILKLLFKFLIILGALAAIVLIFALLFKREWISVRFVSIFASFLTVSYIFAPMALRRYKYERGREQVEEEKRKDKELGHLR